MEGTSIWMLCAIGVCYGFSARGKRGGGEDSYSYMPVFLGERNYRGYKIMALKLLALAASSRPPIPDLVDYTAALYRELWPGYTPQEELSDRQRIDDMLNRSAVRTL